MKIETIQHVISIIGAFIVGIVGGYDAIFSMLLVLVFADIITGFIRACYNKEISSKVLRRGLVNKILYILFIWIGVLADKVLYDMTGSYITIADKTFLIRDVIVIYLILEELISVLENAANIGLPVPAWLRSILKQVDDVANVNAAKALRKILHEKLGLDTRTDDDDSERSE